ncbi:hypothetical protein M8J75_004302 [Diaphorina citri]|nr:hypothetical protein M8J75_004302 [Diaphorina citri]
MSECEIFVCGISSRHVIHYVHVGKCHVVNELSSLYNGARLPIRKILGGAFHMYLRTSLECCHENHREI